MANYSRIGYPIAKERERPTRPRPERVPFKLTGYYGVQCCFRTDMKEAIYSVCIMEVGEFRSFPTHLMAQNLRLPRIYTPSGLYQDGLPT